jgi:hypothetical protein
VLLQAIPDSTCWSHSIYLSLAAEEAKERKAAANDGHSYISMTSLTQAHAEDKHIPHDDIHIGQVKLVSRSSDYCTRWPAIK